MPSPTSPKSLVLPGNLPQQALIADDYRTLLLWLEATWMNERAAHNSEFLNYDSLDDWLFTLAQACGNALTNGKIARHTAIAHTRVQSLGKLLDQCGGSFGGPGVVKKELLIQIIVAWYWASGRDETTKPKDLRDADKHIPIDPKTVQGWLRNAAITREKLRYETQHATLWHLPAKPEIVVCFVEADQVDSRVRDFLQGVASISAPIQITPTVIRQAKDFLNIPREPRAYGDSIILLWSSNSASMWTDDGWISRMNEVGRTISSGVILWVKLDDAPLPQTLTCAQHTMPLNHDIAQAIRTRLGLAMSGAHTVASMAVPARPARVYDLDEPNGSPIRIWSKAAGAEQEMRVDLNKPIRVYVDACVRQFGLPTRMTEHGIRAVVEYVFVHAQKCLDSAYSFQAQGIEASMRIELWWQVVSDANPGEKIRGFTQHDESSHALSNEQIRQWVGARVYRAFVKAGLAWNDVPEGEDVP